MLKRRGKKGNHPNAGIQDSKKSAACTACNLNFRMSGIQLMSKVHTVIFAEKTGLSQYILKFIAKPAKLVGFASFPRQFCRYFG